MAKGITRKLRKLLAAKAKAQPRGRSGRFLSPSQVEFAKNEAVTRLREFALWTPKQRTEYQYRIDRIEEVKHEKTERRKRYKSKPKAYRWQPNPDPRTLNDYALIRQGILPKPSQVIRHGQETEYIWTWQGGSALKTAQDFLIYCRPSLPKDSRCYLAVGTGHSSDSVWIGTRLGTVSETFRHSQTLIESKSETTKIIAQRMETGEPSQIDSLWAEIKLLTKESITYEDKSSTGKAVRKRPKAAASTAGHTETPASRKHKVASTKRGRIHPSTGRKTKRKRRRAK